ncbi:MAG TPA: M15 family metallopeptidase [Kofleriaceae bacterium]|nr:M15 family metallopeptidase [Kofleriaceae bacterium]
MALALGACSVTEPSLGQSESASTVLGATGAGGCSTAVVLGLSRQIADEVGCEHPGALVPFAASDTLVITSNAVLPYLEPDAASDLVAEAQSHTLEVNSALRTIAQQYLLYHWYLEGECGIAAAATVGNSNHESGRAVDLENYDDAITSMKSHGWAHDVPGDVVHFDHTASSDVRGRDVTAFQTLWNANNPGDQIAVDGDYGPQTEARLKASPATGFAIGPSCTAQQAEVAAQVVAVDGPDRVAPQSRAHYTISIANHSGADWPAGTQLVLGDTSASPLDDPSWIDAAELAAIASDTPAGATAVIDVDVTTPAETAETPIVQPLALSDGAGTIYGTLTLALTVVPEPAGSAPPPSSDGGDTHDGGELSGGCSAGGGAGLGLAIALAGLRRRRR